MYASLLNKIRPVWVVLGWSTVITSFVIAAMLRGLLLPQLEGGGDLQTDVVNGGPWELALFYVGIFIVSLLAALVLADISRGIIAYFASYVFAAILTYFVLVLPDSLGSFPIPDALIGVSVKFTFDAFFPVLFLVGFIATIFGSALAERIGRMPLTASYAA